MKNDNHPFAGAIAGLAASGVSISIFNASKGNAFVGLTLAAVNIGAAIMLRKKKPSLATGLATAGLGIILLPGKAPSPQLTAGTTSGLGAVFSENMGAVYSQNMRGR